MTFHAPYDKSCRITDGRFATSNQDGPNGAFRVPLQPPSKIKAFCIASNGEEWRPIKGYEGLYSISSHGRVRSEAKKIPVPNGGIRNHPQKMTALEKMDKGYLRASLCTNASINKVLVHRIVAEAFIPNPSAYEQINHIDGNKANNIVTNLEWCTQEYNQHHAIEHGFRTGITTSQIAHIQDLLNQGLGPTEIGELFGKAQQTISDIKAGRVRDTAADERSGWLGPPIWEHVSVSISKTRCPSWEMMCYIKSVFWDPEDLVVQYHPPQSQHVNNHKACLHLWRPLDQTLPLPPSILVGAR